MAQRFTTLNLWEPTYGGQQYNAYNDFDSVEVGNCDNSVGSTNQFGSVSYPNGDGTTLAERQTQMSLWALASSPFILGTNLTQLCQADLKLLMNRSVITVEQDGISPLRPGFLRTGTLAVPSSHTSVSSYLRFGLDLSGPGADRVSSDGRCGAGWTLISQIQP